MEENCYEEEPLSSMWPQDIEDKSNMEINTENEKPNPIEEILSENNNLNEDHYKIDFVRLTELTEYSEAGSHQLKSLINQYKSHKEHSVKLLHEEINSLTRQRLEIERKELEILKEHKYVEKKQISVLEENYDLWGNKNGSVSNLESDLNLNHLILNEDLTGEERDVNYWRGKAIELERMLRESLKRESVLEKKLKESLKGFEAQNLPVDELSSILKRADNFLHFVLQNAPVVIGHQDTELRHRFVYNHFPGLGAEDVIGKTDEELLSGPGMKEFQSFKREVLQNGKPAKREITYETLLFGKKTFLLYVEPVFNKQNEIIGINYIGLEISDIVRKREKLAKVREELAIQRVKEAELSKTNAITEIVGETKKDVA